MAVSVRLQTCILLGCLLFNSCSVISMRTERAYVDSGLQEYVGEFEQQAKLHHVTVDDSHLSVLFQPIKDPRDDSGTTIAYCYQEYVHPTVIVDPLWFSYYDHYKRQALLFHELGHCLLHRDHCDIRDHKKNVSLMTSYIDNSEDYKARQSEYLEELFHADKRCR